MSELEAEVMSEETINQMMGELGVDDANLIPDTIERETEGTVIENLVQSAKSLVMTIWQRGMDQIWALVQAAFRKLIPMLFLRYATGIWLEEIAKDHSITRDPGRFTRLTLTLTKAAGAPLTVSAGDVFFIVEQDPRRYQILEDIEIDAETTAFQLVVEALAPTEIVGETEYIYSARFNAATGLEWDCEEALPFTSIAFNETEFVQNGEDPETDDALRGRVYALKSLEAIELGIDLYYTQLLKTIAGVAHVTLDDVGAFDGVLYYTLYGATGQLTQETLDEAQAAFDLGKMRTDHGVLSLAAPFPLDITISRTGGGTDSEIINAVSEHFLNMERGANFESYLLYDYLHELWPTMIFRVNPTNYNLPTGFYFVPTTTVEDIA